MEIRTRFAPSPTGSLHIGGIRTVLYCYAWAKKNNGAFVVRIEDTDRKRFVEGSIEEIFEMLTKYGLEEDESIRKEGSFGPYIQTNRKEIYQKYVNQLIDNGHAYYCFLEGENLSALQKNHREAGTGLRSPYRDMEPEELKKRIEAGESYVVRMKVPNDRIIEHEDGVQGKMKFDTNMVGDQIILKSDGLPTYHLAVVVDDYLMKISHVFRAIEWITSTPKQILLYESLGWEMPEYYHLCAILDPDGKGKLSKRRGDVAAKDFLEKGYLPEAVLNFLMLLGWASPEERPHGEPEREVYSLNEFVELFDLKDLNKSNPVFNRDKLLWFNQQYINSSTTEELFTTFLRWAHDYKNKENLTDLILKDKPAGSFSKKLNLLKERAKTLDDIYEGIRFFYEVPSQIDWNIKQLKSVQAHIKAIKQDIFELHESLDDDTSRWSDDHWAGSMKKNSEKYGLKAGDSFMVLRVAITGSPYSPPLFESLQILGKREILSRLSA